MIAFFDDGVTGGGSGGQVKKIYVYKQDWKSRVFQCTQLQLEIQVLQLKEQTKIVVWYKDRKYIPWKLNICH